MSTYNRVREQLIRNGMSSVEAMASADCITRNYVGDSADDDKIAELVSQAETLNKIN